MDEVKGYVQIGLIVFTLTFIAGILTSYQMLNSNPNDINLTPFIVSIASLIGILSSIIYLKMVNK